VGCLRVRQTRLPGGEEKERGASVVRGIA